MGLYILGEKEYAKIQTKVFYTFWEYFCLDFVLCSESAPI